VTRQETGIHGEELARNYLEGKGFRVVECNYRRGHGEIDIILKDGETLVFCEVKTRLNDQFGPPEAAITARKQRQLRKTAEGYLFEHGIGEQVCRFDVVAIRFEEGKPVINHLQNAF
jgi:putative endonuclease